MHLKTCCMICNRKISDQEANLITQKIRTEIKSAFKKGFTHFISSFEEDIDLLFADLVIELMDEYPNIVLEAGISYSKKIETSDIYFHRLLSKCKVIGITSLYKTAGCFVKRNRLMVNFSHMVIVINDDFIETAEIINFAKSQNKKLILI